MTENSDARIKGVGQLAAERPEDTALVVHKGFSMQRTEQGLAPEVMAALEADGDDGFIDDDTGGMTLPRVEIRQKPPDRSEEDPPRYEGGFSIYNPLTKSALGQDDIPADEGICVTFLIEMRQRHKYVQPYDNTKKALCDAWDGSTGVGDPGGTCGMCPDAKFPEKENKNDKQLPPRCTESRHILCYDHDFINDDGTVGGAYILKIHPSGLGRLKLFKKLVSGGKGPSSMIAYKYRITAEPGSGKFHIPVFHDKSVEELPPERALALFALKKEAMGYFKEATSTEPEMATDMDVGFPHGANEVPE